MKFAGGNYMAMHKYKGWDFELGTTFTSIHKPYPDYTFHTNQQLSLGTVCAVIDFWDHGRSEGIVTGKNNLREDLKQLLEKE